MSKIYTKESYECRIIKNNIKNEVKDKINEAIKNCVNSHNLVKFKINIGKISYVEHGKKETVIERKYSYTTKDIKIKVFLKGLNKIDYVTFKKIIEDDKLLSVIDFKIDKIEHISEIKKLRNEIYELNKIAGLKIGIYTTNSYYGLYAKSTSVKNKNYFFILCEIAHVNNSTNIELIHQKVNNLKSSFNNMDIRCYNYLILSKNFIINEYKYTDNCIRNLRKNRRIDYAINSSLITNESFKKFLMNLKKKYIAENNSDFYFFINDL